MGYHALWLKIKEKSHFRIWDSVNAKKREVNVPSIYLKYMLKSANLPKYNLLVIFLTTVDWTLHCA